jgi:hypothetical protein
VIPPAFDHLCDDDHDVSIGVLVADPDDVREQRGEEAPLAGGNAIQVWRSDTRTAERSLDELFPTARQIACLGVGAEHLDCSYFGRQRHGEP